MGRQMEFSRKFPQRTGPDSAANEISCNQSETRGMFFLLKLASLCTHYGGGEASEGIFYELKENRFGQCSSENPLNPKAESSWRFLNISIWNKRKKLCLQAIPCLTSSAFVLKLNYTRRWKAGRDGHVDENLKIHQSAVGGCVESQQFVSIGSACRKAIVRSFSIGKKVSCSSCSPSVTSARCAVLLFLSTLTMYKRKRNQQLSVKTGRDIQQVETAPCLVDIRSDKSFQFFPQPKLVCRSHLD